MIDTDTSMATDKFTPTVELKKVHLVATWQYTGACTTCAVCNCSLQMQPSDAPHSHNTSGKCGHYAHSTCLSSWLASKNTVCPICKVPWETSLENIDTATFLTNSSKATKT